MAAVGTDLGSDVDRVEPGSFHNPVRSVLLGLAVAVVAVAVSLLGSLAYVIISVDRLVESSLPCDPAVILETEPLIDPAFSSSFSPAEVKASKDHDECLTASRDLIATAPLGNSVNWITAIATDLVAAMLIVTGWSLAIIGQGGRLHGRTILVMFALSAAAIMLAGLQFHYSETIELVTWITN